MNGAPGAAPRQPGFRPDVAALLLLIGVSVLLALQGTTNVLYALSIPAAGVAGGIALHRRSDLRSRSWAGVPVLLGLTYSVATAAVSLLSELLAGAAGLALLLWLAAEPSPRERWRDAAGALTFPVIAIGVAAVSGLALPASQEFLGIAAGLLVAEILFAGWLYAHPADLSDAGATASRIAED